MEANQPHAVVDEATIMRYITTTFANVHVVTADGNSFFFFGPMDAENNKFPFATLVTNDDYERVSELNRPGVFRLNVGVSKASFLALFGAQVPRPGADGIIDAGYDYAALDTIMPHPVYGNLFWIGVLNPSSATFQKVQPLLAEAYDAAVRKQNQRA